MSSTPESSAPKPTGPLVPFAWHWMMAALLISGLVGVGAGLWQSTWWRESGDELTRYVEPPRDSFRMALKWTNLAQITLSAALVIGGTLMGARFAGLRFSMLAVGWLGILYAVVGSSVYVWFLVSWASWMDSFPPDARILQDLPGGWTAWALAIAFGLLGLGKLLFFTVVIGYFGRFDVRAYLEDPPAWFATASVSPSVKA